ncbi:hypothetical protein SO694_00009331 [Aureococcus anophagefferens]|uniref:Uncharacterized protein n=1 Tax=Aureococcus anophagefferens TaxID=44056 RepID=A0ABR1GEP7_AURAN
MTDAFDAITAQRAAFLASGGGRVCLGNAAGDLDSVVSALAAAALYGGAALARFPREDLALRRDAEAALAHDDAAAAAAGAAPRWLRFVFGGDGGARARPARSCSRTTTPSTAATRRSPSRRRRPSSPSSTTTRTRAARGRDRKDRKSTRARLLLHHARGAAPGPGAASRRRGF